MMFRSRFCAALAGVVSFFITSAPALAETVFLDRFNAAKGLSAQMHMPVLVETDIDFDALVLADPDMADIAAQEHGQLMLLGKRAGQTTLALLDKNEEVLANIPLRIDIDLAALQSLMDQHLPGSGVEIQTAHRGFVLSGELASPADHEAVLTLAKRHAPGRVTDLTRVARPEYAHLDLRHAQLDSSVLRSLRASVAARGDADATGSGAQVEVLPLGNSPAHSARLLSGLTAKGLLETDKHWHASASSQAPVDPLFAVGASPTNESLQLVPMRNASGALALTIHDPGHEARSIVDLVVGQSFLIVAGNGQRLAMSAAQPVIIVTPMAQPAATTAASGPAAPRYKGGHLPAIAPAAVSAQELGTLQAEPLR